MHFGGNERRQRNEFELSKANWLKKEWYCLSNRPKLMYAYAQRFGLQHLRLHRCLMLRITLWAYANVVSRRQTKTKGRQSFLLWCERPLARFWWEHRYVWRVFLGRMYGYLYVTVFFVSHDTYIQYIAVQPPQSLIQWLRWVLILLPRWEWLLIVPIVYSCSLMLGTVLVNLITFTLVYARIDFLQVMHLWATPVALRRQ